MSTPPSLVAPLNRRGRGILMFDAFLPAEHRGLPTSGFHWAIETPDLGLLELTCDNFAGGYVVTEYDLGFPEIREVTYERPLNDGTFDVSAYVGSRLVSLTITLDSTRGIWSNAEMRSKLSGYLHPSRRPILSFVESGWDIRRRVVCRGANLGMATSRVNGNVMQVNFVVASGLIESYDEYTADVEVNDTFTDHTADMDNAGDVNAHWAVDIRNLNLGASGGIGVLGSGVELVLDPGPNEHSIKMMLDLAETEVLSVFSSDKSAVIVDTVTGSRRSVFQHVDRVSDWWQLPPGYHQFGFWVLDANGVRINPVSNAKRAAWGPIAAVMPAGTDVSATYPLVAAFHDYSALAVGLPPSTYTGPTMTVPGEYIELADGKTWVYFRGDLDVPWNPPKYNADGTEETFQVPAQWVTGQVPGLAPVGGTVGKWQPDATLRSVWSLGGSDTAGTGGTGTVGLSFARIAWHDTWMT
jgi:hypothetical protein